MRGCRASQRAPLPGAGVGQPSRQPCLGGLGGSGVGGVWCCVCFWPWSGPLSGKQRRSPYISPINPINPIILSTPSTQPLGGWRILQAAPASGRSARRKGDGPERSSLNSSVSGALLTVVISAAARFAAATTDQQGRWRRVSGRSPVLGRGTPIHAHSHPLAATPACWLSVSLCCRPLGSPRRLGVCAGAAGQPCSSVLSGQSLPYPQSIWVFAVPSPALVLDQHLG